MDGIIIAPFIILLVVFGTMSLIVDSLYTCTNIEDSVDNHNSQIYDLEDCGIYNDYLDE